MKGQSFSVEHVARVRVSAALASLAEVLDHLRWGRNPRWERAASASPECAEREGTSHHKEQVMKTSIAMPKISSSDVLDALGLERRRTTSRRVAASLGLTALGAVLGAGAMLLGIAMLGHEHQAA